MRPASAGLGLTRSASKKRVADFEKWAVGHLILIVRLAGLGHEFLPRNGALYTSLGTIPYLLRSILNELLLIKDIKAGDFSNKLLLF